jgi:hypothetical protein
VWDLATGGLLYRVQTEFTAPLKAVQFDHAQLFRATGSCVERFAVDW